MKNIRIILLHADITLLRLFMSASSFLWAVMLFWPGDTFARPTYEYMSHFAIEEVWATVFLLHAIISITSLAFKQIRYLSVLGEGFLGCLLWTSSCFLMLLSVFPPPAAISAEIIAAIASWWILVRYPSIR